ncbi:MAG: type II secretion system protein [Planctomycetes bacterium]|nr:type II secretion system protein [Planctomycetota bacterium]
MRKNGFTLIELLVVIAIIAMLLAILVPSLLYVKEQATAILCAANQKGLSMGWLLYMDDNDGYLIGGSTYNSTDYRWCERPLIASAPMPIPFGVNPANYEANMASGQLNMEARMRGIRAGTLFPYAESEKLYHCPNDKNYVRETTEYKVYRTYAIPGLMNGEDFRTNTITLPGGGTRQFKMAKKNNDIVSPSQKYIFVEEDVVNSPVHGKQWHNLGGFVLMGGSNYWQWWDIPAFYHNDRSTLGFADGHAEKHTWEDPRTLYLMKNEPDPSTGSVPGNTQTNNEDIIYMNRGYFPGR